MIRKLQTRGPHPELPRAAALLARTAALRCLVLSILMAQPFAITLSQDISPAFHHDQQRTGRTTNRGPTEPVLRWTYTTGASIDASPVEAPDGTIYIASTDSHLHALTPAGALKWAYASGESIYSTPSIGTEGTIHFADLAGFYYALRPDGSSRWIRALSGGAFERRAIASPAVAASGQSFIGGWNDHFYSFAPDGGLLWEIALGGEGQITAAPALDSAGNVYLATLDPSDKRNLAVFRFDSRGNVAWKATRSLGVDRNRIISSPAIDLGRGTLYVGASRETDGCLFAFSLSDGKPAFSNVLPKGIVSSPALAADGTVYVGCLDGALYALDPAAGGSRWSFATGAGFLIGSPTVDVAGRIYTGDSDGVIHALFPDGTRLWSFATQANIASAPVIAGDRTLYATSYDGKLYAIGQARRPRTRLK